MFGSSIRTTIQNKHVSLRTKWSFCHGRPSPWENQDVHQDGAGNLKDLDFVWRNSVWSIVRCSPNSPPFHFPIFILIVSYLCRKAITKKPLFKNKCLRNISNFLVFYWRNNVVHIFYEIFTDPFMMLIPQRYTFTW